MFQEKLNELLKKNNVTQTNLANFLNCTPQAVYKWCKDNNEPSNMNLVKIANYFNVTTDYLLGNEKEANKIENKNNEKNAIKNALINVGYMKDDEDLTDKELDIIMKFINNNKDFIKCYKKMHKD